MYIWFGGAVALFVWVDSTVYSLQYTVYTIYISPCTVLWIPEVNNDLVYCIFGLVQGLSLCGWTLYRIYNYTSVISPCTVLRIPEVNNDLVYCIYLVWWCSGSVCVGGLSTVYTSVPVQAVLYYGYQK